MVTRIGPKTPRRNFLAKWRTKRKLTQEQLADRVGTYKAQISNWEGGKRALTFDVQSALAEALDIEPQDLFRDPDRPSADELLRDASPQILNEAIEIIKVLVARR
jgi:transcriptional regulator with XRE-family HTH domain